MDIAWIQVFVLTLSECVAPAGKTICQEREFELQFLNQADCEFALQQLVSLKSESENVIVNADKSNCAPSARRQEVFASVDAINDANRKTDGWKAPVIDESTPGPSKVAHQERLANLQTCEDTGGVAPCKIGEIIIESASEQGDKVWRRKD
ncbi:MAG: hypothetical protein OER97_10295 [Gammaproteobacteria bacterium]|nr:hypothetical protein [Gammaproteobacteria bacterium]